MEVSVCKALPACTRCVLGIVGGTIPVLRQRDSSFVKGPAHSRTASTTMSGCRPHSRSSKGLLAGQAAPLAPESDLHLDSTRSWQRAATYAADSFCHRACLRELGGPSSPLPSPLQPHFLRDLLADSTDFAAVRSPSHGYVGPLAADQASPAGHWAAWADAATPTLGKSTARVCKEARATVAANVLFRDLHIITRQDDDRQKREVIANGLPLWGGVQLAVDTNFISALDANGRPRQHQRNIVYCRCRPPHRTLKQRAYPPRALARLVCCLVVLALEVAGRWSAEAIQLARCRARSPPPHLFASSAAALAQRWSGCVDLLGQRGPDLIRFRPADLPMQAAPSQESRGKEEHRGRSGTSSDELLHKLAKALIVQSDYLSRLQNDHTVIFTFRNGDGPQLMVPLLHEVAANWRDQHSKGKVTKSLKQTLLQYVTAEIITRVTTFASDRAPGCPSLDEILVAYGRAKHHDTALFGAQYNYLDGSASEHKLVPRQDGTLTQDQIVADARRLKTLLKQQEMIIKFSAARNAQPDSTSETATFVLELSLQIPAAAEAMAIFRKWFASSALLLLSLRLKPARPERSPLIKEIQEAVGWCMSAQQGEQLIANMPAWRPDLFRVLLPLVGIMHLRRPLLAQLSRGWYLRVILSAPVRGARAANQGEGCEGCRIPCLRQQPSAAYDWLSLPGLFQEATLRYVLPADLVRPVPAEQFRSESSGTCHRPVGAASPAEPAASLNERQHFAGTASPAHGLTINRATTDTELTRQRPGGAVGELQAACEQVTLQACSGRIRRGGCADQALGATDSPETTGPGLLAAVRAAESIMKGDQARAEPGKN
ncbi:hypothetical protein AK812_SmicGene38836 [Symbiodinium microadriaticum]|uniref:Uncharacterized protein n=1 Tax=Symbiodinium microadriaticum TaxID=2951 RepID=A0A1Q9CCR1_SYMMI|nr:hypothetical protein AK812_SmicGene38836 [Symbiodinium microadriaticum]